MLRDVFSLYSRLIVISLVFNIHQDSFECKSGYFMKIYYIGTLVILVLHILVSAVMATISMQGTVIEVIYIYNYLCTIIIFHIHTHYMTRIDYI